MSKKYYAVYKFETKEDFDKNFHEIYSAGYEHGFADGRINALSYILDALHKDFSGEEHSTAEWQSRQNKIRQWRKEQAEKERKEQAEIKALINEIEKENEETQTFNIVI